MDERRGDEGRREREGDGVREGRVGEDPGRSKWMGEGGFKGHLCRGHRLWTKRELCEAHRSSVAARTTGPLKAS